MARLHRTECDERKNEVSAAGRQDRHEPERVWAEKPHGTPSKRTNLTLEEIDFKIWLGEDEG